MSSFFDPNRAEWGNTKTYRVRRPDTGQYFAGFTSNFDWMDSSRMLSPVEVNTALTEIAARRERGENIPMVEVVEYVQITYEAGRNNEASGMLTPEKLAKACWSLWAMQQETLGQSNHALANFAQRIIDEHGFKYPYVVRREQQPKEHRVIEGFNGLYSSSKSKRRYMACETRADVIYARLGSDGTRFDVFDIRTALPAALN